MDLPQVDQATRTAYSSGNATDDTETLPVVDRDVMIDVLCSAAKIDLTTVRIVGGKVVKFSMFGMESTTVDRLPLVAFYLLKSGSSTRVSVSVRGGASRATRTGEELEVMVNSLDVVCYRESDEAEVGETSVSPPVFAFFVWVAISDADGLVLSVSYGTCDGGVVLQETVGLPRFGCFSDPAVPTLSYGLVE